MNGHRVWSTLRPWVKLMLQHRRRLLIGALLMAATVLSAVGLLALSGWFITATALAGLMLTAGIAVSLDVYVPGGGIRAFALSRTVSRYLERVYNHDTVLRLLADLRVQVFRQLSQLDMAALSRLRAVQWLNRLTTDIDTLDNLYLRLLAPPLVTALGILVVGGLIAVFLPLTGGVLITGLLSLLLALTLGLGRLCRHASAELTVAQEHLRTTTVEQLQGLGELKAFHSLGHHQRTLSDRDADLQGHQSVLANRIALANALGTFGVQSATVLILLTALSAFQADWISGPVAVMMPLATLALGEAFATLPKAFAHAGGTLAAAARLNETAPQGPGASIHADANGSEQAKQNHDLDEQATLVWDQVEVRYGEQSALSAFTLQLAPGEQLGLIGPSGSGKSTAAALAARLISPTGGRVYWGKQDLSTLNTEHWRRRLGYLTQHSDLFNETLATNLLLGNPDASDEQLWEALDMVALADTVSRFPDGLDTRVGEGGRQLSGGEARRVALARVILKDTSLVILDEPFSGLDQATALTIRQRLTPWLSGRTLLAIGHDDTALPHVDRVVRLPSVFS